MAWKVREPLDPTGELSGPDIVRYVFFNSAGIGFTFTFSIFQATESVRLQLAGEARILNASGVILHGNSTTIIELVQGTIAPAVSLMAVFNRIHAVTLYAMIKFVGEAIGKRNALINGNASQDSIDHSTRVLRALMRNGLVITAVLSSSFSLMLAFLSKPVFDMACEDPNQAKLATISTSNLWLGSIFLLLRILFEQFVFNDSLKIILISSGFCLVTLLLGSAASILLGEDYGLAGMSWGFNSETILTFSCYLTVLLCLKENRAIQYFNFKSIGITKHWNLIPPVLKFALIKLFPAFHEVLIPLVVSMLAAASDEQNTFKFNPSLALYNYIRIVMIAFKIALSKIISQLKGAEVEDETLKINNIRKAIIYGCITTTGSSIVVTATIYCLIRYTTEDITDDGLTLLAWYAGIGLTTAIGMALSTILSMINNKLATFATVVSTSISWLALATFVGAFVGKQVDFDTVGPMFFAANFLIMAILAVPSAQLLNPETLTAAVGGENTLCGKHARLCRPCPTGTSRDVVPDDGARSDASLLGLGEASMGAEGMGAPPSDMPLELVSPVETESTGYARL